MAEANVGELIYGWANRDITHIAIMPVTVLFACAPGQHVHAHGIFAYEPDDMYKAKNAIIDPYLESSLMQGDKCYVFLYPDSITSLSHNWTHPDIDDEYDGCDL